MTKYTYYVKDTGTDVYSLHPTFDDAVAGTNKIGLTAGGSKTHIRTTQTKVQKSAMRHPIRKPITI